MKYVAAASAKITVNILLENPMASTGIVIASMEMVELFVNMVGQILRKKVVLLLDLSIYFLRFNYNRRWIKYSVGLWGVVT